MGFANLPSYFGLAFTLIGSGFGLSYFVASLKNGTHQAEKDLIDTQQRRIDLLEAELEDLHRVDQSQAQELLRLHRLIEKSYLSSTSSLIDPNSQKSTQFVP